MYLARSIRKRRLRLIRNFESFIRMGELTRQKAKDEKSEKRIAVIEAIPMTCSQKTLTGIGSFISAWMMHMESMDYALHSDFPIYF